MMCAALWESLVWISNGLSTKPFVILFILHANSRVVPKISVGSPTSQLIIQHYIVSRIDSIIR